MVPSDGEDFPILLRRRSSVSEMVSRIPLQTGHMKILIPPKRPVSKHPTVLSYTYFSLRALR